MSDFHLAPNQCLVYISATRPFSNLSATHVAEIIHKYIQDQHEYYKVKLVTDGLGMPVHEQDIHVVSADNVVSNSTPRTFAEVFYHVTDSAVLARGFVIKKHDNALYSTSRSALGSGIFGKYTQPAGDSLRISCQNMYHLQDQPHGESLSIAALSTHAYLDRIIRALGKDANPEMYVSMNDTRHLVTLWNIVFYRTHDSISQADFDNVLVAYIHKFLAPAEIQDTHTREDIIELPINHILEFMGYHGIIADDHYNNYWDRGCVCYDIHNATVIMGDTARY